MNKETQIKELEEKLKTAIYALNFYAQIQNWSEEYLHEDHIVINNDIESIPNGLYTLNVAGARARKTLKDLI